MSQSRSDAPKSEPLSLWRFARQLLCELFALFGQPEQIAGQQLIAAKARAQLLIWLRAGETFMRHLLLIEAAALKARLGPPASPPATLPAQEKTPARTPAVQEQRRDPDRPEDWRVVFHVFPRLPCKTHASSRARAKPAPDPDAWRTSFISADSVARWKRDREIWRAECAALSATRNQLLPSRADFPSPMRGGAGVGVSAHLSANAPPSPLPLPPLARGGGFYSAWPLARRAEALLRAFNNPAPFARRLAQRLKRRARDVMRLLAIPDGADRAIARETLRCLSAAGHAASPAPNTS